METSNNLAFEYFKIGNAVTAFYVIQTLLFLNALYKEQKLVAALYNDTKRSCLVTWAFAGTYIFVIVGCAFMELYLRFSIESSSEILVSSFFAAVGRIIVISTLALGCTKIIALLKPEPTP